MSEVSQGFEALVRYLKRTSWRPVDADHRTSLWLPPEAVTEQHGLQAVLPADPSMTDASELIEKSLKVVAWAEKRGLDEVRHDVVTGGADRLSVRLPADAFDGQVSLATAPDLLVAVRNLVVGAAVGVETEDPLVLPPRRPQHVEAYVSRAQVSTRPGSFVVDVELPGDELSADALELEAGTPLGRRITDRVRAVATGATALAAQIGDGDRDVTQFAQSAAVTGNATELDALAQLGRGQGRAHRYQLRVAQTPLWGKEAVRPSVLTITPAHQAVLAEAATYLRERRSRDGVTVTGLVVRLARSGAHGAGDVTVEGVDDDSGVTRRYAVNLSEDDYADALRAHREGYRVVVVGDLDVRGTRLTLRRIKSFDVLADPSAV
ncbi:hypothetical protein SAMN06264364_10876 [Quadrisphaera granulorum]|uniref:Uncharacterized protein n=1 Tax=Quadrisphaera granulorum TaxID=317664 RepID=A0A316A9U2_9ACTN|nr:hypothetical protein [Quadrisphaera granulorum]PWJ54169.1 hypothetical protein BXY45_10876 [Quadrisphaera granulorum]SZE96308.1 hypothetical protein SAMN06264364_10876 [Quadrisphaera granulorum]